MLKPAIGVLETEIFPPSAVRRRTKTCRWGGDPRFGPPALELPPGDGKALADLALAGLAPLFAIFSADSDQPHLAWAHLIVRSLPAAGEPPRSRAPARRLPSWRSGSEFGSSTPL